MSTFCEEAEERAEEAEKVHGSGFSVLSFARSPTCALNSSERRLQRRARLQKQTEQAATGQQPERPAEKDGRHPAWLQVQGRL